ncbi:hypothetical protein HYH03_004989 [Edaphochlamys debaryana]|uniref:Uncharacterized protein n=1 Tax=Edaphochlamys debaryana TaxID=47281 RepID=A0A835Y6M1_9CHLO|nr:hypothetical protein HYH03_004989 [Edaphochlamys debaryana]|eukprot:KAG2496983.1 hypothetical protein HYH03_004989 [Edaphochlamys debaryana]
MATEVDAASVSSPKASADPATRNGSSRSPGKVAFSDKNDEFEYRSRRRYSDDESSSDRSTASSSTSSSSSDGSSDARRRDSGSKRRGRSSKDKDSHSKRSLASRRGDGDKDKGRSRGKHGLAGNTTHHSSSSSNVSSALGAPHGYGGAPQLPGFAPAPPGHPQLALHPCQGLVTAGPGYWQPCMSAPSQACCAPALTAPGPLPCYPPPGADPCTTPTKSYASPRGARGPPPTLLVSASYHPTLAHSSAAASYPASSYPSYGQAPCQPQPYPQPQLHGTFWHTLPVSQLAPPQPPPAHCFGQGCGQGQGQLVDSMQSLSLGGATGPAPASGPWPQPATQPLPQLPPHLCGQTMPVTLPVLPVPGPMQAQAGGMLLYDNTTEEVVMADDVMAKELTKQGHTLVPLAEAYRSRLAAMQSTVNGGLLGRREALLQRHAALAARAAEVAAQRAALERDVAALAEDMVGRIRSAESLKQALLGRDAAEVGSQLDALQRLMGDIVAASGAGPPAFLNAYRPLADACNRQAGRGGTGPGQTGRRQPNGRVASRDNTVVSACLLVSRPLPAPSEPPSAPDLPSEAAAYADLVAAHGALGRLLGVKDGMIAHLLGERDAMREELQQVVERYSSELGALEEQCQGYYERLLELGEAGAGGGGGGRRRRSDGA